MYSEEICQAKEDNKMGEKMYVKARFGVSSAASILQGLPSSVIRVSLSLKENEEMMVSPLVRPFIRSLLLSSALFCLVSHCYYLLALSLFLFQRTGISTPCQTAHCLDGWFLGYSESFLGSARLANPQHLLPFRPCPCLLRSDPGK